MNYCLEYRVRDPEKNHRSLETDPEDLKHAGKLLRSSPLKNYAVEANSFGLSEFFFPEDRALVKYSAPHTLRIYGSYKSRIHAMAKRLGLPYSAKAVRKATL